MDARIADATLSVAERRTIERFVSLMGDAADDDLLGIWLYGSRARGEEVHAESDVDLLVIAKGGHQRYGSTALDLSAEAAEAEQESPFAYSVHVHDPEWLRGRREIESFYIREVDRDKIVLAGSPLE